MKAVIFTVLLFCIFVSFALRVSDLQKYKQADKIWLKHGAVDASQAQFLATSILQNNEEFVQSDFSADEKRRAFLVKFNQPITKTMKKRLENIGVKFLEYVPHQTYLVKGTPKQLTAAREMTDMVSFVTEYLPEYKISSELHAPEDIVTESMKHEDFEEFDSWTRSLIHVFGTKYRPQSDESQDRALVIGIHLLPDNERTIEETLAVSQDYSQLLDMSEIPVAFLRAVSKNKIVLAVPVKSVKKAAQVLAGHTESHWIEHMSHVIGKRDNWDIKGVMQSGDVKSDPSSLPFAKAGITGKNQIVAYADSGLDVYSCFFHDESNKVPYAKNRLQNETSLHRKIHAYGTFMDGLDDDHGHGTHIAGTIAGSSLYPNSPISKYNGHAPDAKLAVFDIGCQNKDGCECTKYGANCPCSMFPQGKCPSSKSLVLPFDLHAAYFPWAYEMGARIHSNSIGGSIGFGYTGTTREMDRFIHEHPDFLIFWSAGNSGRNEGFMTLTGPTKQSKNAVVVGCSTSPYEGWNDVMKNVRDYKARADLMKKAIDQQGFCSCNTTCQTYACAQAKLLSTEQGCCQVFDNCKVDHPEQATNPQANVVNMCCQKCAVKNLNNEQYVSLYQKENLAIFSSLGPSMDGRIKPDLVAPGYFAISAKSHESNPENVCSPSKAKDVKFNVKEMAGTSMATPAAAANGALVRDYFMQGFYPTGEANAAHAIQPSAALVKAILIASARPMKGLARHFTPLAAYTPAQRRYFEGFGLINLSNALYLKQQQDDAAVMGLYVSDTNKLYTHQVHTVSVTLPKQTELSVTLVWTDPAASPAASIALVNDLDLVIVYKNTTYLGNAVDNSIVDADRVNNVEKVIIDDALPGTYQVQVRGFHVPEGPQRYALVINAKGMDATSVASTLVKSKMIRSVGKDSVFASSDADSVAPTSEVSWFNKDISIKTWVFALIVSAQGIALLVAVIVLIAVITMLLKNGKQQQQHAYQQVQQ